MLGITDYSDTIVRVFTDNNNVTQKLQIHFFLCN